ncbi:hypothetical protein JTE90_000258 [Oedothorax gibbosus]|uniref:Uncharacterized protein n=1 Tax=Oedothorax gibbosus TaxID=931172 RepID=A0AAV6VUM0_9ARAC|nr:hypothetical protein JTE90_000258 [Oedothorax gibbosus]
MTLIFSRYYYNRNLADADRNERKRQIFISSPLAAAVWRLPRYPSPTWETWVSVTRQRIISLYAGKATRLRFRLKWILVVVIRVQAFTQVSHILPVAFSFLFEMLPHYTFFELASTSSITSSTFTVAPLPSLSCPNGSLEASSGSHL